MLVPFIYFAMEGDTWTDFMVFLSLFRVVFQFFLRLGVLASAGVDLRKTSHFF